MKATFTGPEITDIQVTDRKGNPVTVKGFQPAVRGPLMARFTDHSPKSIYDLSYQGKVPSGKRAVPVSRDYTQHPGSTELELVTIKRLDTEYRERQGPGRRCNLSLDQVTEINRLLNDGQTIKQVAQLTDQSPSIVAQINSGKAYWYARS